MGKLSICLEYYIHKLFFSLSKWLTPPDKGKAGKGRRSSPRSSDWGEKLRNARKEWQLYAFLACVMVANVIVFVWRACQFKDMKDVNGMAPNWLYMISRASGEGQDSSTRLL